MLSSTFTPFKKERYLNTLTFIQKLQHLLHFCLVIMLSNFRAQLNFFNLNHLLVLLGFSLLFLFLIDGFAKIHDLSNRKTILTLIGNNNKVESYILRHTQSLRRRNHPNILTPMGNKLNLFCADFLIYKRRSLFFTL